VFNYFTVTTGKIFINPTEQRAFFLNNSFSFISLLNLKLYYHVVSLVFCLELPQSQSGGFEGNTVTSPGGPIR
jgi:hypothetical protein